MSAGWIYLRKDASAYYIGQTSSPSSRDCVYRKENAAVSTIDIYHVDDMDGVENELMDALSDYQFFPDNGRRNETFVLDSRVPATYFAIKAKHEGVVGNNESVTKAALKAAQERDAAIAELNSLKKSVDENNQRKRDAELAAKKKQKDSEESWDEFRAFIQAMLASWAICGASCFIGMLFVHHNAEVWASKFMQDPLETIAGMMIFIGVIGFFPGMMMPGALGLISWLFNFGDKGTYGTCFILVLLLAVVFSRARGLEHSDSRKIREDRAKAMQVLYEKYAPKNPEFSR